MPKIPTPPGDSSPPRPYRIYNTLGALIDDGYTLAFSCNEVIDGRPCGFWKDIDLEKLAARLGRDHGSMKGDLIPHHLWCLRCGSRDLSLQLRPPMPPATRENAPR